MGLRCTINLEIDSSVSNNVMNNNYFGVKYKESYKDRLLFSHCIHYINSGCSEKKEVALDWSCVEERGDNPLAKEAINFKMEGRRRVERPRV